MKIFTQDNFSLGVKMNKDDISIQSLFSISKTFFIMSVIIAHTPIDSKFIQMNVLFKVLGTIGVIGFFMISGFVFAYEKRNPIQFAKRKLGTVIFPWIICGTFTFTLSSLFGSYQNRFSFNDYFYFIIGKGSLYYYLTMLLSIYFVFYFFRSYLKIIYYMCYATPVYLLLTYINIIPNHYQYLNILSWISFFSIGYLSNKMKIFNFFISFADKNLAALTILFITSIIISIRIDQTTYFTPFNIFTEVLGVSLILVYSNKLGKKRVFGQWLENIGNKSFSIYLLHMPIAGFVNILFQIIDFKFLDYFKPLIVLIVILMCLHTYVVIVNIFSKEDNKVIFYNIIGLRS